MGFINTSQSSWNLHLDLLYTRNHLPCWEHKDLGTKSTLASLEMGNEISSMLACREVCAGVCSL